MYVVVFAVTIKHLLKYVENSFFKINFVNIFFLQKYRLKKKSSNYFKSYYYFLICLREIEKKVFYPFIS